jgi:DNA helicase-2/ATP-dependent DNA helicase PcrA
VKFYARKEVKDVLAYLYAILNPSDTLSLLRIMNIPSRKIGDTTLARLQNFSNERSLTLWQSLKHIGMVEGIAEPTKNRIHAFGELIDEGQRLSETSSVSALTEWVLKKTNMEKWLRDDTDEGETRWQNVMELLSVTKKYDKLAPLESLTSFLEEVALVSEVDKLENIQEALTLMTLHLCKGLEFRSVSIVGCEEGLLPHSSANFDRNQMEEERRLLYVGMTRAKEFLNVFHAQSRTLWGNTQSNARSRFLDDIPLSVLEVKSNERESKYGWLTSSTPSKGTWWQPAQKKVESFSQETVSADDMNQEWSGQSEEEIEEGMRIEHKTMGRGTVLSRKGDVVEVMFDSGATKKLATSIAPIKVLMKE